MFARRLAPTVIVALLLFVAGCTGGGFVVTASHPAKELVRLPDGRTVKQLGWDIKTFVVPPTSYAVLYAYQTDFDLSQIKMTDVENTLPRGLRDEILDVWNSHAADVARANHANLATVAAKHGFITYGLRFERLDGKWRTDSPGFYNVSAKFGFHWP